MSSIGDLSELDTSLSSSITSEEDDHVRKGKSTQKTGRKKMMLNDTLDNKYEMKNLHCQLEQLQKELNVERDTAMSFRKKLTLSNKEKLEQTAKFNDEMCALHNQNAGLQAQLEQQVDVSTQLEFQLTRANKQISDEKKLLTQKETSASGTIHELEELLEEYKKRAESLTSDIKTSQTNHAAEIEALRRTIADRDKIIQETCQQQQTVSSERNSMTDLIKQQERTIAEHQTQYDSIHDEYKKTREHLTQSVSELEELREKEKSNLQQLQEYSVKIRSLSEACEAERAAQLQSQFNGEIVQLKVQDMETCIDEERRANVQLASDVEKISNQLREIEQAFAEECVQHKSTQAKLEKCEKEYTLSQRQLQTELSDKRNLVSNLKQQLDQHQTNVDDLKSELGRTRKRQHTFEEQYGGSMRELELLMLNFEMNPQEMERAELHEDKQTSPTVVLSTVKHTLTLYKRKLEQTANELIKVTELYDKLSHENKSYKDESRAKDKALEEARTSLISTTRDADRLAQQNSDSRDKMNVMRSDVQELKTRNNQLEQIQNALNHELSDIRMRQVEDNEEKMRFLHGLYQRLLPPVHNKHAQHSAESYKWAELTDLVLEQAVNLLGERQHIKEKIAELDADKMKAAELVERIKLDYEAQLTGLSQNNDRERTVWSQEKQALLKQHDEILQDAELARNKDRECNEEAWNRVNQTTEQMNKMESEIHNLKSRITALQKHNSSVLCAFALMSAAYYPLLHKHTELIKQRTVLDLQVNRYEVFKRQVSVLLHTLDSEGIDGESRRFDQGVRCSRLLKFRRAVIVVLACNRLRKLTRLSCRTLTFSDGHINNLICVGSLKYVQNREEYDGSVMTESDIIDWLTNKDVITTILTCTKELITSLRQIHKQESVLSYDQLLTQTRVSFRRLLDSIQTIYPMRFTDLTMTPRHDRHSLANMLYRGLNKTLQYGCTEYTSIIPTQKILTNLQERVINFIKTLHKSEIDRKTLRDKLLTLQDSTEELRRVEQQAANMEVELDVLKDQNTRMVPSNKYESTVKELNATLHREKQAQQLLNEQSERLRAITQQLESEEQARREQQKQLHSATQELEKDKDHLNNKLETINSLKKRISILELERTQLQDTVFDADVALKNASKDKDMLTRYLNSLKITLDKCRTDVLTTDIAKTLSVQASRLLEEESPVCPEVLSIQSMVSCFSDCVRATRNHMQGLTDEIDSHKKHVNRLKDELSAACRRQMSGPSEITNKPQLLDRSANMENRFQLDMAPSDSETDFMSVRQEPENSSDGSMTGKLAFIARRPAPELRPDPSGQELHHQRSIREQPSGISTRSHRSAASGKGKPKTWKI